MNITCRICGDVFDGTQVHDCRGRPRPVLADVVNHPPHYTRGTIEVIDYILDKFADDYLLGQVCKYISRADYKGAPVEDLRKAEWYLKRAIAEREKA